MKLPEIIEVISAQYRKELNRIYKLKREIDNIDAELMDAEKHNLENITAARYNHLRTRYGEAKKELDSIKAYAQGIHDARETLLNLYESEEEN